MADTDLAPMPCGCMYYEYGPPVRCKVHRLSFGYAEIPCDIHEFENTETVWPGTKHHCLTRTCHKCGEIEGRVQ